MLGTDAFVSLGRTVGQALGLPHLPLVTVAHPIGGVDSAIVAGRADAIVERVLAALTGDPAPPASFTAGRAARATAPDDLEGFQAFVVAEGWGDGLPALPPTPERVARILGGRRPTEVVATLAPGQGLATFEAVAANAALAGAGPEHLAVIVAAVRAVAEPRFNLKAIQTTTHPCTPLVIVNGPVARRLGIAGGANALGQGYRANAVIGRALRLTLQNVGGASPGQVDRATLGHAGKFTYCLSENEEHSPWEPLHVERGFGRDESTVTVCGSEAPHNVNDHGSTTAEGMMCALASTGATSGNNNVYLGGEPLLLIGPEHAATIAGDGWSKRDLKRAFWDRARVPLSAISAENLARFIAIDPARFRDRAPADTVPLAVSADDVMVVVAGGPGKHSAVVPTFGATRSVTVRIEDR
ncbi:MAG TPA: hypothetical protein VID04_08275 [Methylomirabilota bacterium]